MQFVTPARATFPKDVRLLSRCDYTRLSAGRTGYTCPAFLIVWQTNLLGRPRLGITASRKVGGAVVRNRFKRQVRECFRHFVSCLPSVDLNVIARKRVASLNNAVLRRELDSAFRQIGAHVCYLDS